MTSEELEKLIIQGFYDTIEIYKKENERNQNYKDLKDFTLIKVKRKD